MIGDDDLPANWEKGVGEASRPLTTGGYYQHRFYRRLPGSNQHVERFLELVVDTSGTPPDKHHIELNVCTEDDVEVERKQRLECESIAVNDPDSMEHQRITESYMENRAIEIMKEYADWVV